MALIHKKIRGMTVLILCCSWLLTGCGTDAPKPLKIGEQAPDLVANDLQGQPVSLDDYAGKPVVLRFFVPDCKFCRADTAVFNELYRIYKEKGLGVVYVNTDPKSGEVRKFVDDLKITFPVVLDPERSLADRYGVQVVPQTVVMDPNHRIIGVILGGVSKEALDTLLLPFLK